MRRRISIIHLAVLVVVGGSAAAAHGQCEPEPTGFQRFQQRLASFRSGFEAAPADSPIDSPEPSGYEQRSTVYQKGMAIRNVAVMQRGPLLIKPPSVQKSVVSQKSEAPKKSLQKAEVPQKSFQKAETAGCSSLRHGRAAAKSGRTRSCGLQLRCRLTGHCEPCGYCYPSRLGELVERLDTALLKVFPRPEGCCPSAGQHEACGCGSDDGWQAPLLPVPELEGDPQFNGNPFRDDTLPLPPIPAPPGQEARLLQPVPADATAGVEGTVRPVVFYAEPVRIESDGL